jgi:NAD(P)-dependent dehydrogenase (short-subunit alcohol dehydrogenase family)/acyl carrier protein
VLSLLAAEEDADELRRGVSGGLAATLVLAQALEDADLPARLWVVTRQCLATAEDDRALRPAQGLVWGLGRTVGWERPHRWGGLIDLPEELDERCGERLCATLAGEESQAAVRSSGVLVRRMLRAPLSPHRPARGWRPRGTVLVTGGTGGIGGHVARWLAGRGAEHLLLASRRGEDAPGARELAAELSAAGTRATVAACDVSDREQLADLLARVPADLPLSAVFHAAGVSRGEWIRSLTPKQMERMLAPKVQAAVHLHELTERLALEAFVLFSSLTSVFGSAKLGAYAAGNAFLDSLAEHRRARGLAATSISWSSWAGEGMAAEEAELSERAGLGTMAPELTIQILAEALDRDEPHLIVADIDWTRTAPMLELSHLGSLIRELPDAQGGPFGQAGDGALPRRLLELPPAERARETLELVRAELALVLGMTSGEEIPAQALFSDLGLDSVSVVGLRARLQTSTGCQLPTTMIFDHPSVGGLADYLLGLLDEDAQRVDRREPVGRS